MDRTEELKKKRYWGEGDITYVISKYEYPHNESCEGTMCYCATRAKKENPKKWKKFLEADDGNNKK